MIKEDVNMHILVIMFDVYLLLNEYQKCIALTTLKQSFKIA